MWFRLSDSVISPAENYYCKTLLIKIGLQLRFTYSHLYNYSSYTTDEMSDPSVSTL